MAKVITFGELMLRLQPYNYERFVQASTFEATFGGGEANVAVSLANYGFDAEFVTKLPAHSIGGDYNHVSVAEVEKLAGGDGSGRVRR